MSRSKPALLLACALSMTMSTALAREVERLSAGDAGCPADLAAAKADAEEKPADDTARSAKPAPAPVRGKPTVRGGDASSPGNRLNAPRWHSFLPGMFR